MHRASTLNSTPNARFQPWQGPTGPRWRLRGGNGKHWSSDSSTCTTHRGLQANNHNCKTSHPSTNMHRGVTRGCRYIVHQHSHHPDLTADEASFTHGEEGRREQLPVDVQLMHFICPAQDEFNATCKEARHRQQLAQRALTQTMELLRNRPLEVGGLWTALQLRYETWHTLVNAAEAPTEAQDAGVLHPQPLDEKCRTQGKTCLRSQTGVAFARRP